MHVALPEAGGASPLSMEGTFRRKWRDGVGQEGGAALVTGENSTDGPEWGGVGTGCTQEGKRLDLGPWRQAGQFAQDSGARSYRASWVLLRV